MEQNSVKNVNAPKIETFTFGETVVRVVMDDHKTPWFVASDVAKALDLQNLQMSLRGSKARDFQDGIDDRYVSNAYIPHPQSQNKALNVIVILEPGVYQLIFKSRKPEAKVFQAWVFEEVLPALRKTGKYEMPAEQEDFDENGTAITMKGAVQKMDYEAQAATTFLQIIRECVGQELTTFQRKEFGDFKHILLHKQAQTEERLINAMQALAQKVGKELDFEVPPQASYVYLIRRIDFINVAGLLKCKVGKSNDPAFRKFRLESGGADLEVLEEIWFPNEHTALLWERAIKALFDTYKADREWFLLEERHIHFFKALAKCLIVLYA